MYCLSARHPAFIICSDNGAEPLEHFSFAMSLMLNCVSRGLRGRLLDERATLHFQCPCLVRCLKHSVFSEVPCGLFPWSVSWHPLRWLRRRLLSGGDTSLHLLSLVPFRWLCSEFQGWHLPVDVSPTLRSEEVQLVFHRALLSDVIS